MWIVKRTEKLFGGDCLICRENVTEYPAGFLNNERLDHMSSRPFLRTCLIRAQDILRRTIVMIPVLI